MLFDFYLKLSYKSVLRELVNHFIASLYDYPLYLPNIVSICRNEVV